MRIAELGRRSGVPVPTIKYYLRAGLLPPGELTSPNQARYGEDHLHRLRLVRAMVDVGGLSIAAVGEVFAALGEQRKGVSGALRTVEAAVTPVPEDLDAEAVALGVAFLERQGWVPDDRSPAFRALVGVLGTAREVGQEGFADLLDGYARACLGLAEADLDYAIGDGAEPELDQALERVVVGTVLGDAALAAVRRLARREVAIRRFGHAEDECPRGECAGDGCAGESGVVENGAREGGA
ncbi:MULTISPECIES: MerR family transcriptional regulator [Actinosynnema]|uniref:MerR family transcriptional regulator n=1 Tax=Actinosynnema TaxID=40566 RepID=UPI0020A4C69F|nr:MerR family transcriptional regulator [Actinosynnema pretiosum]MCP2095483.1 DNA-binding transcriptional regulator, MerR family [Actinosynnema pretiosum]